VRLLYVQKKTSGEVFEKISPGTDFRQVDESPLSELPIGLLPFWPYLRRATDSLLALHHSHSWCIHSASFSCLISLPYQSYTHQSYSRDYNFDSSRSANYDN